MKIALISDTHWGCRNGNHQFLKYFTKFYREIFFPKIDELNIDTIIHLGDFVDKRKYIDFVTYDTLKREFLLPCKQRNLDVHFIIGNHDTTYKSTNRINALDCILRDMDVDNFHYYSEPCIKEFDRLPIVFVPWINPENRDTTMQLIQSSDADVLFGHLELQGFQMHRGQVVHHGLDHKIFNRFDLVCTGHFHHKSSKDNVEYLGSPYEMTWSDYNDPRGFHIFDTSSRELDYVRNPHKMFSKIFYDDCKNDNDQLLKRDYSNIEGTYVKIIVQEKSNAYTFDLFVDHVNSFNPTHLQVVEDNFNLDSHPESELADQAQDTQTIIRRYIDNLNFREDQARMVDNLFTELYNEALSME